MHLQSRRSSKGLHDIHSPSNHTDGEKGLLAVLFTTGLLQQQSTGNENSKPATPSVCQEHCKQAKNEKKKKKTRNKGVIQILSSLFSEDFSGCLLKTALATKCYPWRTIASLAHQNILQRAPSSKISPFFPTILKHAKLG